MIFQEYYVFIGVSGVLVVWIIMYQFGEVIEGIVCVLWIVVGVINVEEVLQGVVIQGYVGQVVYIDDIVDVWMGGV